MGTSEVSRLAGPTRVMAASSSAPLYLKVIRCFSISAKYSLASLLVLVPKPARKRARLHLKVNGGGADRGSTVCLWNPTFVVLYMPTFIILRVLLPLFKLRNAVKRHFLLILGRLLQHNNNK